MKYYLFSLVFLLVCVGCSSDQEVSSGLKAYDLVSSPCKHYMAQGSTEQRLRTFLYLQADGAGTVTCSLEDLYANCAMKQVFIKINKSGKQLEMVLFPKNNGSANCICNYNVAFKLSKLLPGNYHLKIYSADEKQMYSKETLEYDGPLNLSSHERTQIVLKYGTLP